MKQIFSVALLGLSMFASAQLSLAAKANLIFPTGSPSWKNISNTASAAIDNTGKNNVGFNVGLSLKANLPMAFFLMPELYYTTFRNEFTDPASNTTFKIKNNRIDLPVLVGHKVLGDMLGVFIGPVASYNLSKEDTFNDFKENARDNFTVGYQFGAQVEIKKLLINARYEGAFSKDQRNFINRVSGEEIRYDNRPNLFMVGLGYKF
ncbi:outer membrane beta-barrel protein [Chryseobacterium paridis]|uniref:PorT family protein n=1 Tax=Chryseobacterium paridis TaxID=2800328 RepID=A0ABS1FRC8_9FLAO|nr:outer membrane beta-barrel protein [Chryseobacterium paridis]MBK1894981.1 PorT family protein [Chryseobacterium paridis]